MKKFISIWLALFLTVANVSTIALANDEDQNVNSVELRGIVTDEQNAFIVAAPVVLEDAQGQKFTATTDEKGHYKITGLKPGIYTLTVELDGFGKFTEQIDLKNKRTVDFNIPLKVFIEEQVEIKNDAGGISSEPDKNLSATILSPKELEALPDDPDELLDTLKQMAGAAGGAGDSSVYVNGFSERGRIPSKESIQQIRINANPFAPEFSEPGFARIEIITKPGSDTFHGGFNFRFNDDFLNARQATAGFKAPTQIRNYGGQFNGPLIRNRWDFTMDFNRMEFDDNSFVNAIILPTDTLTPTPFSTTVLLPSRNTHFSMRTNYLFSKKHTLGLQYRYNGGERTPQLGNFDLPERLATTTSRDNTLRVSLTTIATEHAVNEFRLQLNRRSFGSSALTSTPAIYVSEAFNAGGNQNQLFSDNTTDALEATNDITYTLGKHTIKTGMRAEAAKLNNLNRSNFGGSFTFGSDFVRDAQGNILDAAGQIIRDPSGRPLDPNNPGVPVGISSLDLYSRVLSGTPGYTPSQFTINRGDPFIGFTQWEFGWYVQDDWRISPTFTFSYGVRQEMQTHLQDKLNIAPRFSLAWTLDKKSVIRAGGGMFYSRLDTGITSQTIRSDGIHQQNFIFARPDFFETIPTSFSGSSSRVSTYVKDAELNAPYQMLGTVSYDRQLPWKLSGSVSYTWNRGVHLLRTRNINAPINGVKPQPDQGALFVYESTGISNRNQMSVNLRTGFSPRFTVSGSYTLAYTKSDTDGGNPSNPYDLSIDYGRSSNDIRHNVFLFGSITTFWNIRLTPFVNITSGRPFNITTGRDINNDTVFADRPSFANLGDPGAIVTPYGIFNPNPLSGDEIIPRNFGDGPGMVNVSLGISRTFGFGPAIGGFPGMSAAGGNGSANNRGNNQQGNQQAGNNQQGGRNNQRGGNQGGNQNSAMGQAMNQVGPMIARGGGPGGGGPGGGGPGGGGFGGGGMRGGGMFGGQTRHKYNITVDVRANNLFNHTNYLFYNGQLTSPFFGRANNTGQPRKIEASLRFSF
jgi:hypothetical protein